MQLLQGAEPSPPSKPWLQLVALLVLFSQYHMQYTYTHRYHALQFISHEDFVHSSTDKFEECAVVETAILRSKQNPANVW